MAEIKPFKGITYNTKDFSKLICPPYDVISEEDKKKLKQKDTYNFVNIILKEDEEKNYAKAKEYFDGWLKDGILKESEEDCIYYIEEEFTSGNKQHKRHGFSCLIKLEDYGKGDIFPHEQTFPKIKEDRYRLMEDTMLNTEQIFLIYDDDESHVKDILEKAEQHKLIKGEDKDSGLKIKVSAISDKNVLQILERVFKENKLLIADGHHRYETALQFSKDHEEEGAKYILAYLVASNDPGLMVLTTNRLIFGLDELFENTLIDKMSDEFKLEETDADFDRPLKNKKKEKSFVMYLPKKKKFYMATPKKETEDLDVELLHEKVIKDVIGLSKEDQAEKRNIEYVKGKSEAFEKLCSDKKYNVGFFLNAPTISDIFETIAKGKVMPQKSTFFYPKIYSGIVLRKIE